MPGIELILLALMPVLLLVSSIFSSAETALFSLTQADKLRCKMSPESYSAVMRLTSSPRSLLVAILLGNVTVNSSYYVASSVVGTKVFGPLGIALFGIGSLFAMILAGEVVPKSIAVAHRVWLCRLTARPLLRAYGVLHPVHSFAERFIIAPTVRVLTPSNDAASSTLEVDELGALLDVGRRDGVLKAGEQELLGEVIRLSSVRVREVMTPRVDVRWLTPQATVAEFLKLVGDTNTTKVPVCRGEFGADSLVGLIELKRVLPLLNRDANAATLTLAQLPTALEAARFVPERAKLDQLLEYFRTTGTDTALCVNETGEVTGVVRLDAVIEELVGIGLDDQTAADVADMQVRMIGIGQWEVPGRLNVKDWADFFGERSAAADPRVSTVAGIVLAKLGRVPKAGDECTLGDLQLKVLQMDGRVIERVMVSLAAVTAALEKDVERE